MDQFGFEMARLEPRRESGFTEGGFSR